MLLVWVNLVLVSVKVVYVRSLPESPTRFPTLSTLDRTWLAPGTRERKGQDEVTASSGTGLKKCFLDHMAA